MSAVTVDSMSSLKGASFSYGKLASETRYSILSWNKFQKCFQFPRAIKRYNASDSRASSSYGYTPKIDAKRDTPKQNTSFDLKQTCAESFFADSSDFMILGDSLPEKSDDSSMLLSRDMNELTLEVYGS